MIHIQYSGAMPYTDISKRRACQRRYYSRNKSYFKSKNIRRRKELINFVISFKQGPCADCGVKYPYYVMDFDHRDNRVKLDNINQMVNYHSFSKEKILKEIQKCDLVCSNCHRVRTYSRIAG